MKNQLLYALTLCWPVTVDAQTTDEQNQRCESWEQPIRLGELPQSFIHESSGLAQSRENPDIWYTHNDSGSGAQIHAFNLSGTFLGTTDIVGAQSIDWEAMAAGPCPNAHNSSCLYIGDIGDNDRERASIQIYAIPEPSPGEDIEVITTWNLRYPDEAHDAEALLVHPINGEITLITKAGNGQSHVFAVPQSNESTEQEMTLLADISIFGINSNQRKITGGAWSTNGQQIVLRNYFDALIWNVNPCDPLAHWNQSPTQRVGVGMTRQGEAIAFDRLGNIIITSEGTPMPILQTQCNAYNSVHTSCEN